MIASSVNRELINAKWRKIPNGNGERKGLNRYDEIDFRRSAINSLVREMLQNSLDAQLETKTQVQVAFDWFTIRKEDIPDYELIICAYEKAKEKKYIRDTTTLPNFIGNHINIRGFERYRDFRVNLGNYNEIDRGDRSITMKWNRTSSGILYSPSDISLIEM